MKTLLPGDRDPHSSCFTLNPCFRWWTSLGGKLFSKVNINVNAEGRGPVTPRMTRPALFSHHNAYSGPHRRL